MPIAFYCLQISVSRSLNVKLSFEWTFRAPPTIPYTVAFRFAAPKIPFPVFIPIIVPAREGCHQVLIGTIEFKVFLVVELGTPVTLLPFNWCVNNIGTGNLKLTIHVIRMKSRLHSIYASKYGLDSTFRWPARHTEWVIKRILPLWEPAVISLRKWDACQKHTHSQEHPGYNCLMLSSVGIARCCDNSELSDGDCSQYLLLKWLAETMVMDEWCLHACVLAHAVPRQPL